MKKVILIVTGIIAALGGLAASAVTIKKALKGGD